MKYIYADNLVYLIPPDIADDPAQRIEYVKRRLDAAKEMLAQIVKLKNRLLYLFGPQDLRYRDAFDALQEHLYQLTQSTHNALEWEIELARIAIKTPNDSPLPGALGSESDHGAHRS